ncbi:MAG: hypothetical protein K8H90_04250 [Thermoanaerobaculia bacterium]|nr:hypothetical protein [Thermoanaerobaculia bacterium]
MTVRDLAFEHLEIERRILRHRAASSRRRAKVCLVRCLRIRRGSPR